MEKQFDILRYSNQSENLPIQRQLCCSEVSIFIFMQEKWHTILK